MYFRTCMLTSYFLSHISYYYCNNKWIPDCCPKLLFLTLLALYHILMLTSEPWLDLSNILKLFFYFWKILDETDWKQELPSNSKKLSERLLVSSTISMSWECQRLCLGTINDLLSWKVTSTVSKTGLFIIPKYSSQASLSICVKNR